MNQDDKLINQYVKDLPDDTIIDSIFHDKRTQHADDAIDYENIDELADDEFENNNIQNEDDEFEKLLTAEELEAQNMAEDQFEQMFGGDDNDNDNEQLDLQMFDDEASKKHQLEFEQRKATKKRKLEKIVAKLEKQRMKNNISYYYPDYSKFKPFNFHLFSQLSPKFFKYQHPFNKNVKPLVPTKLNLEIDVDQRKFKSNNESNITNITNITQKDLDFINNLQHQSKIKYLNQFHDNIEKESSNFDNDLILSNSVWDLETEKVPINKIYIDDYQQDDEIIYEDTNIDIKLDQNDPNLLFVPLPPTKINKSTNESKFNFSNDEDYQLLRKNYNTKQRSQLSNLHIQHSTVALRLQSPFFKWKRQSRELRSYHRSNFNIRSGSIMSFSKIKVKKKKFKNKKIEDIFKTSGDLTTGDSANLVAMEYAEQYPPILSNFGMGSKLINYYRKEKSDDNSRPKAPIGETHILGVEDRSPFWNFGEVAPGDFVTTLYNNMIRAPIFKHESKSTDFLIIRSQGGGSHQKFYLRNINFNFAVGNTFPVEVPAPHSRKVTNISKNRLKTIVFRVMNNKNAPRISVKDVSKHFPEHSDMQNRQRLKEFMEYQRTGPDQGYWKVRGMNDNIPSEEDIRTMITPEDAVLMESMQVGNQNLEDNQTLFGDKKKKEEDEDDKTDEVENDLSIWDLSKNFTIANQTKQMLLLSGEGDPTGIGLGYSFLRSTQKIPFKPLFEKKDETIPKAAQAAYNAKLYQQEITRIWYSQRSSLVERNDDVDPLQGLKIKKVDHEKYFDEKINHENDSKILKITRRVKDSNGIFIRKTTTIEDPNVIRLYIKRKQDLEQEYLKKLEIQDIVPTSDVELNKLRKQALESKLANLEKRSKQAKAKKPEFKAAAAEGATIIDANTVMLPDGSYVIGGKGIGKGKSRTRRCATCGAFGHIKTNKQCPMYSQTIAEQNLDRDRPPKKSIIASSKHPLARRLKSRHLTGISIGGTIGSGLFIGMGYALGMGGPASVLIGYSVVGYSLLTVVNSLGELSTQFPVSGSFNAYYTRFIDPSWGYTLGLMYAISWCISFPSELISAAITVQYWNQSISPAVWVAIFWVVIVSINLFGVIGFGEAEIILAILKVLAVIGFLIVGICITCGVGNQGYIGGRYWSYSFGGVELSCLAAAESKNPDQSVPRAVKNTFWRITIFYLCTAIVIGCLVPYTNEDLLTGDGVTASPFVIAINAGGIKVLPHIMNAVIVIAVVSVGNSSVYGCSRTLASLAAQGLIPQLFGYIDREGRPLFSIMFTNIIGLLGFLVAYIDEDTVFTWFFSVCSLASFFIWGFINICHLRWRYALYERHRSLDEVIFKSPLGIFGSISGLILLVLVVIGEIWISIWPIGSNADVVTFWQNCLSLPLLLAIYVLHKTYARSWNCLWVKLEDIDLDTGRREVNIENLKQELAEERQKLKNKPIYYKVYRFFC
ncbi:unnamed protein product [Candida verbasci]|uniref:Transcription initiation factor TFIID subunit 1 n=1 Tax=Candida verbasci TaxID=1227364 RepID=A0A9W4X8V8_9ASCO|nr:unnamed protein product [Candida verbasci]